MAYFTRSGLAQYKGLYKSSTRLSEANYQHRIFLSHSHYDRDLVEAIQGWLDSLGLSVYVDWLDENMPQVISPETALRLRDKIKKCQKFILLATENSKNSRWVPWELGCADGLKEKNNIGILTVREDYQDFSGSEYLAIYPRILPDDATGKPGIFAPSKTGGVFFTNWIRGSSNPF